MSVTNPSLPASNLRRRPFTIRLAPQFLNRLLSRRQQTVISPESITGLLFGIADEDLVVVQAFRSLAGGDETSTRESEMFDSVLANARKDPEISLLELVGWYAVRINGGLLQSDVQFHDLHFQRSNDLALVLKQEGNTSVLMELYCRSTDGMLSSEGHRWGAVRQALGSTLVGPVEVTMRSKFQDDFFLQTHQVTSSAEEESSSPNWKRSVQLNTKRALEWLAVSRNEKGLKSDAVFQAPTPARELSAPPREKAKESRHLLPQAATHQQSATSLFPQRDRKAATSSKTIFAGTPPNVPAIMPARPRRRSLPWISSALIFAVAAGLTFGLVYNRGPFSGDSAPGFLKSLFPAPGLRLRLETQGDRLLLSWNRHHPAVRNTKGGILQIDDGAQHRLVTLDASQISNGSVLYRPTSDDVTFRLEVEGLRNEKVSESVRVLEMPKPGSTLDVSAPSTATTALPTDHPATSQQPNGGAEHTAVRPVSPPPAHTSTTVILPKTGVVKTNNTAVSRPVTAPSSVPAGNSPSAPPSYNLPIKRAETQGQVSFDILSTPPAQAKKNEPATPASNSPAPSPAVTPTETAKSMPPPERAAAPAPPVENLNPEKQNPLLVPGSAPPSNTAVPKSSTAVPEPPSPQKASANYQAPRPLRQILPNTRLMPPGVLATAVKVEVILSVDETGHVTEAHLADGTKKVSSFVVSASIVAAKQWVFEPAMLNGKPVPSKHSVAFQF